MGGLADSIMADLRQVNSCMDGAAQAMRTCRLAESFALHCCVAAQALRQMTRLPGQAGLVLDHLWHRHAALQQRAHFLPAASAAE